MNKRKQTSGTPDRKASGSSNPKPLSYRMMAYTMVVLSAVLGQVSLIALGLFLYHGSFHLVQLNLDETSLLWMDAGLCMAFFSQHSFMVRKRYRKWLAKYIRYEFHPALYSIASGIMLLGIVVFWQQSDIIVISSEGAGYWLLRCGYFLSIVGFAWGNLSLGTFDSFGLNSILNHVRDIKPAPRNFVVRGPYRWVRHPLYFCSLLMIWSCPYISMDRLLFNMLFTVWIVIGMRMEERDLLDVFGRAYQEYREKVPILIPTRIRPGM